MISNCKDVSIPIKTLEEKYQTALFKWIWSSIGTEGDFHFCLHAFQIVFDILKAKKKVNKYFKIKMAQI